MKKIIKQKTKEDQSIDILKRVAKRVEEATVDIHSMKRDLKFVNLSLGQVERNTEIMKVDIERLKNEMGEVKADMGGLKTDVSKIKIDVSTMKKDIKEIKKDTEGLIETTTHILKQAVTLDEHNDLSQRVTTLEQS